MAVKHHGERIKAALELERVPQNALAIEMDMDAGAMSRTLTQPEIDGWTGYLLGRYHERLLQKRNNRQVSQR